MIRSPIRLGVCVALATAATACAASGAAAEPARPPAVAPASPGARVWVSDGSTRALEIRVPVTDRGPSKVEARSGTTFYRMSLNRDGPSGDDSLMRFDVERSDSQGAGRSDVRVSVSVRMRRGARVTLARLARPDGTTTTITAMLE